MLGQAHRQAYDHRQNDQDIFPKAKRITFDVFPCNVDQQTRSNRRAAFFEENEIKSAVLVLRTNLYLRSTKKGPFECQRVVMNL